MKPFCPSSTDVQEKHAKKHVAGGRTVGYMSIWKSRRGASKRRNMTTKSVSGMQIASGEIIMRRISSQTVDISI